MMTAVEHSVAKDAERRLLAATMRSRDTFERACDAGLSEALLLSAMTRKLYIAQADHYATTSEAPGPEAIKLRLGRDASAYDEIDFAQPAEPAHVPQLVQALKNAQLHRGIAEAMKRASIAASSGDPEATRKHLDDADDLKRELTGDNVIRLRTSLPRIEWLEARQICEPLPPPTFVSRHLQLGPGRTNTLIGYAGSLKTYLAQHLALCVAAGRQAFDRFDVHRGRVKHIDFDQGSYATKRRYQRLMAAAGIGVEDIDGRLQLAVHPPLHLNTPHAFDLYMRECDGFDLVIIDAFRGAVPGEDENASEVRQFVDLLSHVSERTGATPLLLRHSKKASKEGSAGQMGRGSSALDDAAGCAIEITPTEKNGPRLVHQQKAPATAHGPSFEDFHMGIEDVEIGSDPAGGVRLTYALIETADPVKASAAKFERDAARLLAVVRSHPGITQAALIAKAGMQKGRAAQVLEALEDDRLAVLRGDRNSKTYRVKA